MTWTNQARDHFFRHDDAAFTARYPAAGMPMVAPGGITQLRDVLDKIAGLVPSAAHVWRKWNSRPLVVMGKLHLNRRRWEVRSEPDSPCIGICRVNDELRLFAHKDVVLAFDPLWHNKSWQKWVAWADCLPKSFAAANWHTTGRLHDFLVAIEQALAAADTHPCIASAHRTALGEPPGLTCIYPKLERAAAPPAGPGGGAIRPRPPRGRGPAGGHPAPATGASPARSPARGQKPAAVAVERVVEEVDDPDGDGEGPVINNDVYGMVYEAVGGPAPFCTYVADRATFQANWHAMVGDRPERVLFLCCGPDHACIDAIVQKILRVKNDLHAGFLPGPPHVVGSPQGNAGETYCYGYFDPAQAPGVAGTWNDAFYIGVGTIAAADGPYGGRWTSHVLDAHPPRSHNQPRHHSIRNWFARCIAAGASIHGRHEQYAAKNGLVRKLYQFANPNSRDELKFFTELFLISHGFGAHSLDNKTTGNGVTGQYFGIARPHVVDKLVPQHVYCWTELLRECIQSPASQRINDTLVPATLSLYAASFAPQLDAHLRSVGLYPLVGSQGRLGRRAKMHMHLDVSGASDCVLSYQALHRPYRIDLVFGMADAKFAINMRPLDNSSVSRYSFIEYINNNPFAGIAGQTIPGNLISIYKASPIRNINNDPYYKPMAYQANGRAGDWFPISWQPGAGLTFPQATIKMPNWHVSSNTAQNLNLIDALSLVLSHFR